VQRESQGLHMTTEPELLRAVLADPDADAPRLAFAAFCDARGDARGKFIRLQLRIARLERRDRDDPLAATLADDAGDLRKAHGDAWAAPVVSYASAWTFVRGFVEQATLSARTFLDHAPDLFAVAPVRHVDLTGSRAVLDELFASPHLARIRSLRLEGFGIQDEDAAKLAACPHLGELEWLDLMLNQVGMDGVRAMARSTGLPKLRYVGFFGNRVDPTEQIATDQGVVVDKGLPPEGVHLERELGPIRWLHVDAKTPADDPPPRY
jgi:uncharacterized protein (TIGR02996 family)